MTKISVIIPVYNAEKTLKKCLDSIINQTFDDYEIIIINDGSTDKTKEILDTYKDNSKIIIINQENKGIGFSRNIGIQKASGEYITFVDSDDYIDSKYLEAFYTYASKNNFDMVTGSYYKVVNGKVIAWPCNKFKVGNIKTSPQIISATSYAPWAKIYKRKLIIDNNITFLENKKYEDMPFVCKALLKSKLVGLLKEPYYYYVINKNSQTLTMDEKVFDILDVLKIIKDDYKKEYYLKSEIDYLMIDKVTTYMLQQRYQKKRKVRKKFINAGYKFLNDNVKNWKSNKYYKETSFSKRLIKNHKTLLKLYCMIYGLFS